MVHLRIVESKRINERTYNVGDAQYWKRNGKCYKWTQSQGKVEISEDDYYKALSGTSSKDAKPSDNKKSINTVNHGNDSTIDYDYNKKESTLKFNDYEYKVTPKDTSMSVDDVVKHYANIAKHSNGRAMQWLKQNANLERINKKDSDDMPKGMRSVDTPAGKIYRVDSKSGSDFIQINPTGEDEYELVVYDNGSITPTDKATGISKSDAFKLAKDYMNNSNYYKTGKNEYTPIDKRRNQFSDDSESDYIKYNGVSDFDHTTWDVNGMESTIVRNPSGRGYYLQNEDYDEEFDTKADLINFLKSYNAELQGYDSENDY